MASSANAPVIHLSLKGKRKKKTPKNANPLFTQWLMEWKAEAEEKGWKSAHTYAKALKTLKAFPLPLESGKDCRLLQNFGEKICSMIDEKILEYKKKNGVSSILSVVPAAEAKSDSNINKAKEKKSNIQTTKDLTKIRTITLSKQQDSTSSLDQQENWRGCQASSNKMFTGVHEISDNSDSDHEAPKRKKSIRRSSSEGREYVPTYRSGPYALITTLYQQMKNPQFKGYMSKMELTQAAQSLCDKSFTKPDPGSRYTAWSSSSTLIRKGFMAKMSNPAKYSLTDAGVKLGQRLEEGDHRLGQGLNGVGQDASITSNSSYSAGEKSSISYKSLNSRPSHESADVDHIYIDDEILISSDTELNELNYQAHASPVQRTAHSLSPLPSPWKNGCPKLTKDNFIPGQTSLNDKPLSVDRNNEILEISDDSFSELVSEQNYINLPEKEKTSADDENLELPLFKRLLLAGSVKSDLLKSHIALSADNLLKSKETVSCDKEGKNSDAIAHKAKVNGERIGTSLPTDQFFSSKKFSDKGEKTKAQATKKDMESISKASLQVGSKKPFSHAETNSITKSVISKSVSDKSSTGQVVKTWPVSHNFRCPDQPVQAVKQSATLLDPSSITPMFTFEPQTFEIILCLDNREFYGRTNKTLLPDLIKSGIHCDLRLLHVGDILWIAREKVPPQIDRVVARELVLNYVIERKRLDDLVKSIVEGRMKEQKCRMKNCGLSEAIILIEEYGSIQNFSISEERIKQSIVNSQIIDGFKVKMCQGSEAVVTYLATMTRFLQQHMSSKTLHAVTLDQIKLLKRQQYIGKGEHYVIPFDVFNVNSIKQKDLTTREMFMKQLFQIPGISADRAKAITRMYPTISCLMEAYEKCKDAKEKEKLLSGIKTGKSERNLGVSLSRVLSLLYTQTSSLS